MICVPVKLLSVFGLLFHLAGTAAWSDQVPAGDAVSVLLQSGVMDPMWHYPAKGREKNFQLGLGFSLPGAWTVVNFRKELIELDLRDSSGKSPGSLIYSDLSLMQKEQTTVLEVEAERWVPAEGSRWVSLKGCIPVVIAGKKALSEEMPVDLTRKEQKTSLLLKGVCMVENGREEDGKVTLEVKCGKEDSGKFNMEVKLISPVMLRIAGVELKAPNGSFLEAEPSSIGTVYSPQGPYEWSWGYDLRAGQEEKITVAVSYMTGLKRISIPVNMKCDLSGMEAIDPRKK